MHLTGGPSMGAGGLVGWVRHAPGFPAPDSGPRSGDPMWALNESVQRSLTILDVVSRHEDDIYPKTQLEQIPDSQEV